MCPCCYSNPKAEPDLLPYHLCLVNSIRSWGGAEVWFLDTAQELVARGLKVSLVAQPGSELSRRAQSAGIFCADIPIRFDAALWTLGKLARHFRKTGVTSIVANLTKDLKASTVAGRLAGIPILLGTRESDFPLKNKAYYRWYFNHLATGLLVNSVATRNTVLSSAPWLDPQRVHLLYKGIDTDRFQPCRSSGVEQPKRIGFVGQLIERKGVLDLMAAWSRIDAARRPDAPTLRMAGEGPLLEEISIWRNQLQNPESVEICGFVEDVAAFCKGCSMLVLPSSSEGFGLAAAEASSCGLPVIASDTSSLPEIVAHGETGLLTPVGKPESLAAAIIELLDDPQRAFQLGVQGRKRILDHFDRRKTMTRLLELTGYVPSTQRG